MIECQKILCLLLRLVWFIRIEKHCEFQRKEKKSKHSLCVFVCVNLFFIHVKYYNLFFLVVLGLTFFYSFPWSINLDLLWKKDEEKKKPWSIYIQINFHTRYDWIYGHSKKNWEKKSEIFFFPPPPLHLMKQIRNYA